MSFDNITDAVRQAAELEKKGDAHRVYRVNVAGATKYALAKSPQAAAYAAIGGDKAVKRLTDREITEACLEALGK